MLGRFVSNSNSCTKRCGRNLTKAMEKQMTRNILKRFGLICLTFAAGVGLPLAVVTRAHAQNVGAQAEAERVIVTGSNIPTSEEVGAYPVFNLNRDLINK